MHPDESLSALTGDRLGQPADRDRARVGGEDRRGLRQRVELAPQRGLDAQVLEDRFDDQIRTGDRRRLGRRRQPFERRIPCRRIQPTLGDRPLEVPGDPVATGLRPCKVGLVHGHLLADRGMHLSDPMAHQPRTRHEDSLDRHRWLA